MIDKKAYYKKWNAEHRELKRDWMRKYRAGGSKAKKKITRKKTGEKQKECSWCGYAPQGVFCSDKCKDEFERLGV